MGWQEVQQSMLTQSSTSKGQRRHTVLDEGHGEGVEEAVKRRVSEICFWHGRQGYVTAQGTDADTLSDAC